MAEDDRDFIERTVDRSMLLNGKKPTPEYVGKELAKLPIAERVDVLDQMNHRSRTLSNALKRGVDEGSLTIKEAAERISYERAMRGTHENLRRIKR